MTRRSLDLNVRAGTQTFRWEDRVQRTADLLALIPIVNVPASIVSGVISLRKRDYMGVTLSVLGMVSIEGEGATLVKLACHTVYAQRMAKLGARQ
jgi:hypothetical protein